MGHRAAIRGHQKEREGLSEEGESPDLSDSSAISMFANRGS